MGDMLEHMTKEGAVKALRVAKSGLYNGGKIVITCPNDTRPLDVQYYDGNAVRQGDEQLPGIYYGHERQIPYKELMDITFAAGLEVIDVQELDYTYFGGFGMVCQ
jgi:predicted SAM-dependent methyltransferase